MKSRRPALVTLTLLTSLTLAGCGDTGEKKKDEAATSTPAVAPTEAEKAAKEKAAKDAEADFEKALKDLGNAMGEEFGVQPGTYKVTEDQPDYEDMSEALDDDYLAPGTYETKGPAPDSIGCNWVRLEGSSSEPGAILDNDVTFDHTVVVLGEGEFFRTDGCKPWLAQVD